MAARKTSIAGSGDLEPIMEGDKVIGYSAADPSDIPSQVVEDDEPVRDINDEPEEEKQSLSVNEMRVRYERLINFASGRDLDSLTYVELQELNYHMSQLDLAIEERLAQIKEAEMKVAREKLREQALQLGFAFEDLFPKARRVVAPESSDVPVKVRKARVKHAGESVRVPVKYRHPSEPELTWTGRGRRPRWVAEWVAAHGGDDSGILVTE